MKFLLYLFFGLFLWTGSACAQAMPAEVEQELARRDIDRTELLARLREKGVELEGKSREELLQLRPVIEATIAEMEAERSVVAPPDTTNGEPLPNPEPDTLAQRTPPPPPAAGHRLAGE